MKDKNEVNIKELFNQHIARIGQWPPSWSDVEDVIREAYWKGVHTGSVGQEEDTPNESR